ncbi:MAG: UvrD-helicase domain-containing protein [Pseudomonadaceae bacterium]|nr:UvrD-helicase domain-containing protein [Pseudomonadaceae bacterium]
MMRHTNPERLQQANAMQQVAAHPRRHVWVSANAGTGKTEVLTRRMLALLLTDPDLQPAQIVALTFTKEVAREMAARLPARIMAWATLPEEDLRAAIREIIGRVPNDDMLIRARALPQLVLEQPPVITTHHGYGQMVLARFPREAGLADGAIVADEVRQAALLREAFHRTLLDGDDAVQNALDTLLATMADSSLEELTATLVGSWGRLLAVLRRHGGVEATLADLYGTLELDSPAPWPQVTAERGLLEAWISALQASGGANDAKRAAKVDTLLAEDTDEAWRAAFLGSTYKAVKLADAKAAALLGVRMEDMQRLQERVLAAHLADCAAETYRLTEALLVSSVAMQAAYMASKQEARALDFDDMVTGLERVLSGADSAWVHYRLDRRIRHLLLDEGQDNSGVQHRIFNLLAAELLAEPEAVRTVFAVGDLKQSIYRFQGAAPTLFRLLAERMEQGNTEHFAVVPMTVSFRTNQTVLDVVDAVFAGGDAAAAVLGETDGWQVHESVWDNGGGRVELWPLVEIAKSDKVNHDGWAPPAPPENEARGAQQVAMRIMADIQAKLVSGMVMPSTGKPLSYGDVLVLVDDNTTAAQVGAALAHGGVPVQTVSTKLGAAALTEDAVAWLRVLANGRDNAALAQVLKSPLVGWDDERLLALFRLAGDGPWLGHLATVDSATADWLQHGAAVLAAQGPHGALAWLLAGPRVAGYGGDAADVQAAANVLLEAALGVPHVTDLLAKLQDNLPVAMAAGGNRVRVMTVFKAKGLQAPLVYLADAAEKPKNGARDKLLWDEDAAGNPLAVVWKPAEGKTTPALQGWKEAERQRLQADHLRALYVALTRPADMLVVAGWGTPDKTGNVAAPEGSWYAHVAAADIDWTEENGVKVWQREAPAYAAPQPVPETALPTPLPPVPQLVARLDSDELARGEVMHRLLEVLPDVAAEMRETVADAMAARLAPAMAASARAAMVAEVMGVMAALPQFLTSGQAEVAVATARGIGRIDRLVQVDGVWWVLDFKTEPVPPATVPADYVRQLQGYAAALRLGGYAPLQAAVVWTATATLAEVDVGAVAP